jgi:3-hydroxyacyl-[acyl-carrier-protein] dehydratase
MQHPEVPEIDPATLDLTQRVADIEAIRKLNPQRHEMEMITAVTHLDPEKRIIIGFKDALESEFWTRGHMPGFPLLPGVLMIEAAAQLCGFYLGYTGIVKNAILGLAAVEMAKFKRMVRPGDRLVLVGYGLKVDRRLSKVHVVGYVENEEAFRAIVVGAPLKGPSPQG